MKQLLVAVAVLALVTGCAAEDSDKPATTTTPAAEPAEAPSAQTPVGVVTPLAGAPEGIVVTTSGIAAVGVREPDGIRLVDATTGVERSFVPTTGAPRHLSLAGPAGPVLAPHDAVTTSDGTTVVTNEMGGGVVFVRDGAVSASLPAGPVQPGGLAAVGEYAAVADVQGNGVWIYSGPDHELVAQAPLGTKLTHATALGRDLAAFADTDGGAVFIERVDPQVSEVSRIEAPGNPYGLAYDPQRKLLLITLTESNVLRVVDIADPTAPRPIVDLPTVRQANSVAVDTRSGDVLVTGSNPGDESSLQIIPAEALTP
ncbi:YncE family protein [Rhodococcus sp. 1168]|uniref:YncE family protein n=1 Tax=Rhodococcus sp. 1168 TaxID=2018041 RepID=UPI000A0C7C14|nr:hypothetical protein [Rhodococcus sp. 1168]ORI19302.1 hypothetical protein BJI47_12610 [Rhodococcus sp. 1168]